MNELYLAREANELAARLRQAAPFVVIGTASSGHREGRRYSATATESFTGARSVSAAASAKTIAPGYHMIAPASR